MANTVKRALTKSTKQSSNAELPLLGDIRLLGRILGDVIREQEGQKIYDLVEAVRKLSVAFHRDANQSANKELKKLLKGLSADNAVMVLRAFTYFSHLANLAEDRHYVRRRAVYEGLGKLQNGSIDAAMKNFNRQKFRIKK